MVLNYIIILWHSKHKNKKQTIFQFKYFSVNWTLSLVWVTYGQLFPKLIYVNKTELIKSNSATSKGYR